MRIVNNISAMNTNRVLGATDGALGKTLEKLSSGLRINRAGDDAAGLAISEKMRSQIRSMNQAIRNAQDGISLIQTAEGALNEVQSILHRMRELSIQASNDTLTSDDKNKLQDEVNQLIDEVDRIAKTTQFNTMELLDGTLASGNDGVKFHIGPNTGSGHTLTVHIRDMQAGSLGSGANNTLKSINIATDPTKAIDAIDAALEQVSAQRSLLGAVQNRLEHTIANLGVTMENLQAAESRIRDVDMAQEMTQFTKNQILMQSATAMLAQANMKPQAVLQLLG